VGKRYINSHSYAKKKKINISPTIDRRYKILIFIVVLAMTILVGNLYYMQIVRHGEFEAELALLTRNEIEGESVPRGRIYDRNGVIIVDNIPVKTISYRKVLGVSTREEIEMAYFVADILDLNTTSLSDRDLRRFWILINPEEARVKITPEERTQQKERRITSSELSELQLSRITEEELEELTEKDRTAAYIFTRMNRGYMFMDGIIKGTDVTDEEFALIAENTEFLRGFNTSINWERYYPFGETFRSILGRVASIPAESMEEYLKAGYKLNDRVGVSGLEYQYEEFLRGTKNRYAVLSNREHQLIQAGTRGNDIVLSIDIHLQAYIERVIREEISEARRTNRFARNFRSAYVIIQDPNNGEVLAMAGQRLIRENGRDLFIDDAIGIVNTTITPGSSIKGASHMTGYVHGGLRIGEVRNDACLRIAGTPPRCSFAHFGNIDDIFAMKISSNTYQFRTAIRVGNGVYRSGRPLIVDPIAFEKYRNVFKEFGLGTRTEIDIPNERLGITGTSTNVGRLLDFVIGQYDTYTPMQMSQYVTTIANGGTRFQPRLLKAVYEPTTESRTVLKFENEPVVLNTITYNPAYMSRIQQGFKAVFERGGTGSGIIPSDLKPAGKTGTSQSYIDTTGDGRIDTQTLTLVMVAYAPYDNPKASFTVISPHLSTGAHGITGISRAHRSIAGRVTQKYFEIY